MYLIVYELKGTNIGQQIEIGDRNLTVESLRPHLYKHNNPAGSLKLIVKDETATTTLFESEEVTVQSITDVTDNFFHGVVNFPVVGTLQKNTKYTIELSGVGGYTFNESAYIGWCNGFDLKVVPNSFTPIDTLQDALILEIWERKRIEKGLY